MDLRKCKKCGKEKVLEEFVFNKGHEAYEYKCQLCNKEYKKAYLVKNKETISEQRKCYRTENKEVLREKNKQYRVENKEAIQEKNKQYYSKRNKELLREKNKQYRKTRRKNDINFKLHSNISSAINKYLTRNNGNKSNQSCIKYLNYSINEFRFNLENQFEPWMSWDNYGKYSAKTWNDNNQTTWKWNIDHIIPQSDLPYMSMEDENFKKCWSLNNLRPLSAKQNFIDGVSRMRHTKENRW